MRAFSLGLLGFCAACASAPRSDTGIFYDEVDGAAPSSPEMARCTHVYTEIAGDEEVDGLGTGQALVDRVSGARSTSVRWDHDLEQSDLYFELRDPSRYRLGQPTTDDPDCTSHLLVDIELDIASADGRLDERLSVTVRADTPSAVRLEHWLPLGNLVGDWQPGELEPSDWDLVDVELVANVSAEATVGELALYAQRYRSDSPDEVLTVDAARWPAP